MIIFKLKNCVHSEKSKNTTKTQTCLTAVRATKKTLSVISCSTGLWETWCLGVFVAKLIKLTFHSGLKNYNFKFKRCSFLGAVFIVCFFLQSALAAGTPSKLKEDTSSQMDVRTFSEKQLDKYRNSSEFQYIRNKPEVLTWWGRLKQWMLQKIVDLIQFGTETNVGRTILILLAIAIIIYVAYRMIGADKTGLWAKKNAGQALPDLTDENIHLIDFDELIKEAVSKNNYRLAIRLWYLKTLRNLSGKDFISWKPGKTNYEYVAELAQTQYEASFKNLTRNFEYSWYGETEVTTGEYAALKEQFTRFNQQLR